MSGFLHLAEKVRKGEPIPFPVSAILSAATPLWRLGMLRRRLARRVRVDAHVVSFGNITAGGTGKTPAVIERAKLEVSQGKRVAVLTRGYGSQHRGKATLRGAERSATDEWLGDEPELILRKVPQVLIAKGSNRAAMARHVTEQHEKCDVLILDDGFQYLKLERDENILVVDATNPFGNGHLLPRGILREPIEAMRRATEIVVTRTDQVEDIKPLLYLFEDICPGVPVRLTCHVPKSLWRVCDGRPMRLSDLRSTAVEAVCGIGNPEAFFATVEGLGAHVVSTRAFPDHGMIPETALRSEYMVVVTEKDAIRMETVDENVFALGVELQDYSDYTLGREGFQGWKV